MDRCQLCRTDSPNAKGLIEDYYEALGVLFNIQSTLAGYVDQPRSRFLIGTLYLMTLDESEITRSNLVTTGPLEELLGVQGTVRLKVSGLQDGWWSELSRFGRWRRQSEWLAVEGIDPSHVPELVAQVVALGGRVAAVVPEHKTLEARFLELLGRR